MAEKSIPRTNVVERTPGPWKFFKTDGVIVTQESDYGAHEIAWSDADYEYICRAVNTHGELLAALKTAYRNLDNAFHGRLPSMNDLDLSALMRKAIAKAEAQS